MIGSTLGNYVVGDVLGAGGMGTVHAARHRLLGTRAAIKVLHPQYARDPSVARRFLQEARAALAIDHPGVVRLFDFGQADDGVLYLVMELLDGRSLQAAMAGRRFDERETLGIGAAIADVLAAAHAQGIVHRDLKPENVFLVAGGGVKVLDFGIAKLLSTSGATRTGQLLGTPLYMAPEQVQASRAVGPAADVYALGLVLFELATGQPPFASEDLAGLIGCHLFTPPPRPSALAPVSPGLEALVLACLEKEPAQRPPGMLAVRDRLRALDGGEAWSGAAGRGAGSGWMAAGASGDGRDEAAWRPTVLATAPALPLGSRSGDARRSPSWPSAAPAGAVLPERAAPAAAQGIPGRSRPDSTLGASAGAVARRPTGSGPGWRAVVGPLAFLAVAAVAAVSAWRVAPLLWPPTSARDLRAVASTAPGDARSTSGDARPSPSTVRDHSPPSARDPLRSSVADRSPSGGARATGADRSPSSGAGASGADRSPSSGAGASGADRSPSSGAGASGADRSASGGAGDAAASGAASVARSPAAPGAAARRATSGATRSRGPRRRDREAHAPARGAPRGLPDSATPPAPQPPLETSL